MFTEAMFMDQRCVSDWDLRGGQLWLWTRTQKPDY